MKTINININEPYLSHVLSGEKTIEDRLNRGKFKTLNVGDNLIIGHNNSIFCVECINRYLTFYDMLESEKVCHVVPDKKTIEEAEAVYYKFYTKEEEKEFGVLAIKIKSI